MDINPEILKAIDNEAKGNLVIIQFLRELIDYEIQDPSQFKEYYNFQIDKSLAPAEE